MLADQDAPWRERLAGMLASTGHAVLEAADGLAALQLVRARRPALVVLDVNLLKLDGLTVCRAITRDPELAAIPVLMMTGHRSVIEQQHYLGVGAAAYLLKPLTEREVLTEVRRHLLEAA